MAGQNRTLGRFDLVGIPPAPRGVPQIEVTFDIDANGIVHVSAKDLATGKEQKIRIESSSGITEDEIKKMVKDAEIHAEEDRKAKELAEARNHADSQVYQTEKLLKDYGEKISDADKAAIQKEIANTREAIESSDAGRMRQATEALTQASYKISEAMYREAASQSSARQGAGAGAEAGTGGSSSQGRQDSGKKGGDEDVVDAEYEVVDEENKKNS
jgi:molecular chaperone DnaK